VPIRFAANRGLFPENTARLFANILIPNIGVTCYEALQNVYAFLVVQVDDFHTVVLHKLTSTWEITRVADNNSGYTELYHCSSTKVTRHKGRNKCKSAK